MISEFVDKVAGPMRTVLDEDVERALAAFPARRWSRERHLLTAAELCVLHLVGLGMTNAEIATALFIARSTARTHVKRAHDKCGVPGRSRLALAAWRIWTGGLYPEVRGLTPERLAEERAKRQAMLMEMVA